MVANLVGVTLGPKGRNVVLQNKYGPPKIVNDGETVLKEVFHTYPSVPCPSSVLNRVLRLLWRFHNTVKMRILKMQLKRLVKFVKECRLEI